MLFYNPHDDIRPLFVGHFLISATATEDVPECPGITVERVRLTPQFCPNMPSCSVLFSHLYQMGPTYDPLGGQRRPTSSY